MVPMLSKCSTCAVRNVRTSVVLSCLPRLCVPRELLYLRCQHVALDYTTDADGGYSARLVLQSAQVDNCLRRAIFPTMLARKPSHPFTQLPMVAVEIAQPFVANAAEVGYYERLALALQPMTFCADLALLEALLAFAAALASGPSDVQTNTLDGTHAALRATMVDPVDGVLESADAAELIYIDDMQMAAIHMQLTVMIGDGRINKKPVLGARGPVRGLAGESALHRLLHDPTPASCRAMHAG